MIKVEYGRNQFVTCFDIGLLDERFSKGLSLSGYQIADIKAHPV
jgi:hypothetical protein